MTTRALVLLLPLGALLAFSSCTHPQQPRRLGEKEFASLYLQLVKAGASVREIGGDTSQAHRKAEEVLRSAGVSKEEVDATVRWYNADVTRWKGLYEEVMTVAGDSLGR
jgi:hypothetical protein